MHRWRCHAGSSSSLAASKGFCNATVTMILQHPACRTSIPFTLETPLHVTCTKLAFLRSAASMLSSAIALTMTAILHSFDCVRRCRNRVVLPAILQPE